MGVRVGHVREVAVALAAHLKCIFDFRESDFFGEYCLARMGHGELRIVAQSDPEGEPFEDEFKNYQVLIYSTSKDDVVELRGILVGQSVVEKLRT